MAKSIIDVDINDDKFKAFLSLFSRYDAALKNQSSAWKAVGKEAAGATKIIEEQADLAEAVDKSVDGATKQQKKLKEAATGTNREFSKLASHSKTLASNLKDATLWLFKWSAIAGTVGGLLGAGGLFGIDRLAASAGNTRRQSQGFGISPGALNALRTNYGGKGIDVEGMLQRINEARNDPAQHWLFGANRIRDYQHKDNAQILQELIPNLKASFARSGGNAAAIPGMTAFADVNTLTMLSRLTTEEIDSMAARAEADKKLLDVSDKSLRSFQDFNAQLDRAGTQIKNTFINGLIPLVGPLTNLSAAFASAVKDFMSNKDMGRWLSEFGKGIQDFSRFIGTPEFKQDLSSFASAVGDISLALLNLARWVNKLFFSDSGADATSTEKQFPYADKSVPAMFSKLEREKGLPAGTLDRLYDAESSRGWNPASHLYNERHAGAVGPFQFTRDTAQQYGVTDRHDLTQSATGAAAFLGDMRKRYNGDMAKAVAAYEAGSGNVDKAIEQAAAGGDWLKYMGPSAQRDVRIVIQNATGGNAVVNANQAAQAN